MGEWKERGYVPDSDDEGEEELELLSQIGPSAEAKAGAEQERENPRSDDQKDTPLLAADIGPGCLTEDDYPIVPAHAQSHNPIPTKDDSEKSLQEAESKGARNISKAEENVWTDALPHQHSGYAQFQETGSSVAEQIQNELESGLEIVREALSVSLETLKEHSDKQSTSSSPLSSVRSFSAEDHSQKTPPIHLSPQQRFAEPLGNTSGHAISVGCGSQMRRRNLRQRNPIQLYPYALEGARFQQELLAHGVKPLHLAASIRPRELEALEISDCNFEDDTSGDSLQDAGPSQPESFGPLQPIHTNVSKRPGKQSQGPLVSDDELPDLDAIFDGRFARVPRTRRRTKGVRNARHTAETLDKDNEFHTHDPPLDSVGFTPGGSTEDAIFHVPPSPTHSHRSHSSAEALPRLLRRKPSIRRRTPQALPTPDISSATQNRTGLTPQLDYDPAHSSETSVGSPTSTCFQYSLEQEDNQILQLQRKTKGVLPASFFRLQGQQGTTRREQVRRESVSEDPNVGLPEITQSFSRPRKHHSTETRAANNAVVISDNSASDEDSSPSLVNHPTTSDSSRRYDVWMGLVDGDIEEDNGIDMMLQPQSKKRRLLDPPRKRHRQLGEYGHNKSDHLMIERLQRKRTYKRRKGPTHPEPEWQWRMWNTSKARAPSLGPLDAPGYLNLPRLEQPRFLRIAARCARSRKTSGRQSPSRKCIRLATNSDTYDASSELNNWREGLLERNSPASLNSPIRKSRQKHNLSPGKSLVQGSKRCRTSNTGPNHVWSKPNPSSGGEIQPSPARRRVRDDIQTTMLREANHSNQSSSDAGRTFQMSFDERGLGSLRPSAPVHTRYHNRSGNGVLLSTALDLAKPREAQLESLDREKTRRRILNAFRGRLNSTQLEEVRDEDTEAEIYQPLHHIVDGSGAGSTVKEMPRQVSSRPPRKRPPREINVTSLNSTWEPEASGQNGNAQEDNNVDVLSGVVLAGLGSPEFPITNNSGVVPFRKGICLDKSRFVGQGQLSEVINNLGHGRSLFRSNSDLCTVTRPSKAGYYRWGVFDEQVSQEYSAWFLELKGSLGVSNMQGNRLPHDVAQDVLAAITTLISYLAGPASFQDRKCLITFAEDGVRMSSELVLQVVGEMDSRHSILPANLLKLSCLLLVVIFEIVWIVAAASLDYRLQQEACKTFKTLSLGIVKSVFRGEHLSKVAGLSGSGSGMCSIGHDCLEIDALVLVNNLCKQTTLQTDIWELITEALLAYIGFQPENLVAFRDYELWWKAIFSALPLLELDAAGRVQRGSSTPGWDLVQRLLVRFLHLFVPRRHDTGYSTKQYGRILVHRCYDLVHVWGWQGGHSAIGTFFDAYSSNNLTELFGETPEHHFRLLPNLAPGSRIHVEKTDSGFHAFLGLVAQTALDSRKHDADPKLARRVLRSLSARLVPTKGEEFPRHGNLSINNFIALRNRFDLVLVMYCVMPIEMRPSLRLFQSFVDFKNAHREACKLALACWSQLAQHEILAERSVNLGGLKTPDNDPCTSLLLLSKWHDSIVMEMLAELTSTSRESLGLSEQCPPGNAEARYVLSVSRKPPVELVIEALKVCEQSLDLCLTARQATALFSQSMLGKLLNLCNAAEPELNTLVSAALQIIRVYTRKCVSETTKAVSTDEDSQEYGSWDHFDSMVSDEQNGSIRNGDTHAYMLHNVYPMFRRYFSNIFGSDTSLDHAILQSTVDCWYEVADGLVRVKARNWDDFIGQYSADSWDSLRHTEQSQQYKVYFLAKIIDNNYVLYENNRLQILSSWISALCRPRNFLYWEHLLTSVVLFHDPDNELLFNPPFAVRSDAGNRIEISKSELLERRTTMIYVILRNMHRLVTLSAIPSQTSNSYTKSDFCEILRSTELVMKNSYQDLDADQDAQCDYRAFIGFVVQQMQLYVFDFHKIDPFLTDPAISSAEAYAITAALKRYSLAIQNTGVTKAMVLFLYNASERAAINDDQGQLALQLRNALLDLSQEAIEQLENHESDAALLTLFLRDVFPVYVGHAFSAPGHIIAGPVLRALTYVYENLRCRSDLWRPSSLQHLVSGTEVIFSNAINALKTSKPVVILASPRDLDNFNELVVLIHAAMLRIYEAAQAFPEEVDPSSLIETLLVLKDHILGVREPPSQDSYILDIKADHDVLAMSAIEDSTIRAYARRELQNTLSKTWRRNTSGGWEIIGRGRPRMVRVSRGSNPGAAAETEMEQCKQRTSVVVGEFVEAFVWLDWWD